MCFEKNKKQWTLEEEQLLKNLYQIYGPKKWKQISKHFKKQGFRRNQLEIRQKWINHIDPCISNDQWSYQQLHQLYKMFDEIGSKWCIIRKSIPTRTQIKIKNKFYCNLRVFIRFILLHFEGKNCKNKHMINRIPPNVLNQIYNGQKSIYQYLSLFIEFQFFKNQFRTLIYSMNFNIDKVKLQERIKQYKELYQTFSFQMDELFKQLKATQEFKITFQQNQSYYSDVSSSKNNEMVQTKMKIKTSATFKGPHDVRQHSESYISIKKQEDINIHANSMQRSYSHPQLTSIIQIQPRKNLPSIEKLQIFYVYLPWQLVKVEQQQC